MKIPNVPVNEIINSEKRMSSNWRSFFQNLITQMRLNLSDSGYTIPFLDDAQILELGTSENIGKIIYNTTTARMMINNSGVFQNIDVS